LIVYIGGILILAESREALINHLDALAYLLETLGFVIYHKKSIMSPAHSIEFLGLMIDTKSMMILGLPPDKTKKIHVKSQKMAAMRSVLARDLAR